MPGFEFFGAEEIKEVNEVLETGGGLKKAASYFKDSSEPFVLMNADILTDLDIAAMKIATILRRAKKKDFWDIAELLNHYSVDNFIHFFFKKFPEQMLLISIPQAMTYFTEAASDEDPKTLNGQTWESVKKIISKSVKEYLK